MKRNLLLSVMIAAFVLTTLSLAVADVRVPHIFGSHMVLQRDQALPVWGWAAPGENVTVQVGNFPAVSAVADAQGNWKLSLAAIPAGGPYEMTVKGNNTVTFEDVLIGEVWICSGQSNMEWVVANSLNPEIELPAATNDEIRHIKVPNRTTGVPQTDFDAQWAVCSPATVGGFTACGYFMARELYKTLHVPIGLVNSSWGGSMIEPWTPPIGFDSVPALSSYSKMVRLADPTSAEYKARLTDYLGTLVEWGKKAQDSIANGSLLDPTPEYPNELKPLNGYSNATAMYNAMIHPLIPYAIRGAIWYQGESNHGEGMMYVEKTRAMLNGWRELWNQGDFPFYYVQIAPFNYGAEDPSILAKFWEAQIACEQIPNTGMASTMDIADLVDIHPKNKQEVGRRLALLALNRTHGFRDMLDSGPTFKSMDIEDGKIRIHFNNVGKGLVSRDGKALTWFEVCGEETDYEPADAVIEGDCVVLSSAKVTKPLVARFGWNKNAEPNLSNADGLPALPFRAGELPARDWLAIKVPEAQNYKLVYDLELGKIGNEPQYSVNNHTSVKPFDRIAYFLELQKPGASVKFAYVSMDAFTSDAAKIGVPMASTGATFQQFVNNMTVISNVEGVINGTGLKGNIEFWSYNYGTPNPSKVPNASSEVYDFGDEYSAPAEGYGCLQVHNYEAGQTILAYNNFRAGDGGDAGIGNSTGNTRDWTFAANLGSYEVKRLRILVHEK